VTATAKARFQATPHAAKWADLVVSEAFLAATEAAMLSYVNSLSETIAPPTADAAYQRILGARGFLEALRTLADKGKEPAPRLTTANLDHTR